LGFVPLTSTFSTRRGSVVCVWGGWCVDPLMVVVMLFHIVSTTIAHNKHQPQQTTSSKNMKVRIGRVGLLGVLSLWSLCGTSTEAFSRSASRPPARSSTAFGWFASTQEEGATAPVTTSRPKTQQLGLLTFDLDDTLYPIELVVRAANGTCDKVSS
jgi:hypothetical protein